MMTQARTLRVLVVDDERTVCAGVEKILTRRGHAVEQALSVDEAVGIMAREPAFDIVLADLMMPGASGMDLLRVVKRRWPAVPVLIMTGYASIGSAIEATRAGAAGYLPKPFTPDEIESAIERVSIVMKPAAASKAAPKPAAKAQAAPASGPQAKAADIIDVDMPFDAAEVAASTSKAYVHQLTRSDVVLAADFCPLGDRTCKRYKTKGQCDQPECPLAVAERRKAAKVVAVAPAHDFIDVDMPFSYAEVSALTSEAYADALGRSDMATASRWNPEKAAGRKVLVIDDEPVAANAVRRTLNRRGFRVDEAFTGHEALNRILNEMYDLVLLDMKMPDTNGLELLPTIKKHRPKLPVVMVTGYASIDTAVEAIQRGASDYVSKPFTPEELFTAASQAIRRAAV
ncbi:MAG TPA: response regulator [Vicinamibacterales bacterium]|nr:response regulator [Vicinamibacterales bacterium]